MFPLTIVSWCIQARDQQSVTSPATGTHRVQSWCAVVSAHLDTRHRPFQYFQQEFGRKITSFTFNNSTVVPGRKSMLGTLHFRTSLQMPSTWSIIKFCCSFHLALCLTLIFGSNLSVIDRWYITGMVFSAVYL